MKDAFWGSLLIYFDEMWENFGLLGFFHSAVSPLEMIFAEEYTHQL